MTVKELRQASMGAIPVLDLRPQQGRAETGFPGNLSCFILLGLYWIRLALRVAAVAFKGHFSQVEAFKIVKE